LEGADVVTAGEISFLNGEIEISASSKHYTPPLNSLSYLIEELGSRGVNFNSVTINTGF
tara:strand:+ start:1216 stop:1392 length:177 start_codon:yes stop_codon:yes gene_type:complete